VSQRYEFKEVIRPPFWLITFIYFLLFSLVIAIWAAFDNTAALNAFAIAIVLGLVTIYMATSSIIVANGELRIQRAHIPLHYLGKSEIIEKKRFSVERTRDADPAAYFATTFWISEGLKVEVTDQRDPTPYWLISTRRAEELAQALKS
jgi:glucan phosphoethanolaminetransferase (alkaline phosphatase superfamily)